MKSILYGLAVLALLMVGGCADMSRMGTQLAERVGLRSQEGPGEQYVPVIYPAEYPPVYGNPAATGAGDWQYGASGGLQTDSDSAACTK